MSNTTGAVGGVSGTTTVSVQVRLPANIPLAVTVTLKVPGVATGRLSGVFTTGPRRAVPFWETVQL